MFYIYILFSESSNVFYVGYSEDPYRRVVEHNTKPINTYTSKHRPWLLKAVFKCSTIRSEAIRIEKFIKKQKSRRLLENLCDNSFIPSGALAQLVRVPDIRD